MAEKLLRQFYARIEERNALTENKISKEEALERFYTMSHWGASFDEEGKFIKVEEE